LPFPFNWRVELHPVLVHFPVALLSMALLFDVIGWVRPTSSFRSAGLYCLIAGALGTVLAVLSGRITPEAREREGRVATAVSGLHLPDVAHFFTGRRVEVHEHWGYVLLALVVLWVAARVALALGRLRRPVWAMTAGALTCVVLLITGYLGGELVYRQRDRGRERGQAVPDASAAWSVSRAPLAEATRRSAPRSARVGAGR
jgi:uncharacterized membrane protein